MKEMGILFSVVLCNLWLLWLLSILNNYDIKVLFSNNNNNNNNGYHQQFIKHGKWMPGKRHNMTCDFIPKITCCKNRQSLYFKFHKNQLNKNNPVKELSRILQNKKLLLFGDSLMLELYRGLAEFMGVNTSMERMRAMKTSCSLNLGDNSSVTFLTACTIILQGTREVNEEKKYRMTSEKVIRKEIANHDFIFFNQGLHYDKYIGISEGAIYFNNIGEMLYGKYQ